MFTRNLTKILNLSKSKQLKLLNQPLKWKLIHSSGWSSQQLKDQQLENEKIRLYYGTLTPQIKKLKVFSLTTTFVGIISQPILYEQTLKLGTSLPLIVICCGFVGFFTFVTPVLIHFLTKKYVSELHYNPLTEEYIATIITFFLVKREVKFKLGDVSVPEVPGMFTSFHVKPKTSGKSIPLFVDPKLFEDPTYYAKLMGFDKPIDFRMGSSEKTLEK